MPRLEKKYYEHNIFNAFQKYLQPLKGPENAGLVDAGTVDEIFYQVGVIYKRDYFCIFVVKSVYVALIPCA